MLYDIIYINTSIFTLLLLFFYFLVPTTTTTTTAVGLPDPPCPQRDTRCVEPDDSKIMSTIITNDDSECGGKF